MSITAITRDWGIVPCIVRIVTSDTLATASAPGYLTAQATNITTANEGAFQWLASDSVLVYASNGSEFFTISSDFTSLNALGGQSVSISLTLAQILAMYATPILVAPAPAAGKLNVVTAAYLNIAYGSAAFAGGGAIAIQYDSTVHGGGTAATATIAAATLNAVSANDTLFFTPPTAVLSAAAVAKALYLSNATGAFTTGTGATGTLTVAYRTIVAA